MRPIELMAMLRVMLATCGVLLVIGAISLGGAVGTGVLPPFDMHLSLDGRYALVLHNDLPCVQFEVGMWPGGPLCHAFQIIYTTPRSYRVLVTIPQPEH